MIPTFKLTHQLIELISMYILPYFYRMSGVIDLLRFPFPWLRRISRHVGACSGQYCSKNSMRLHAGLALLRKIYCNSAIKQGEEVTVSVFSCNNASFLEDLFDTVYNLTV